MRLLREARDNADLTQAEVAARLGRTQSFVSKCEKGERRVDVIELADFARLYGQPLTYFVPLEYGPRAREPLNSKRRTPRRPAR